MDFSYLLGYKKYYIYPNGGCSLIIFRILKDCLPAAEFEFIDDSMPETALCNKKQEILNSGAYVLVCAGDVQEILVSKCLESKVPFADGRAYAAFLLGNMIEQETVAGGGYELLEDNRVLHIFPSPSIMHYYYFFDLFCRYIRAEALEYLAHRAFLYCKKIQKQLSLQNYHLEITEGFSIHFAPSRTREIAESLIKEGYDIEYYFATYSYYEQYKEYCKDIPVIIAPWILVDFFTTKKMCLTLSGIIPQIALGRKINIGLGHTFSEAFQFSPMACKQENLHAFIREYFFGFDYYCAIDKRSQQCYEKIFKELNISTKILKVGSSRLDLKLKATPKSHKIQQFVFIPRSTALSYILDAIKLFLKHSLKVVLRLHPATLNLNSYLGAEIAYKDMLPVNENFSLDESRDIELDMLYKSIVISDSSSVAYSTPLSTLIPTILYAPPIPTFDLRVQNFGFSYDDPILHRVAFDAQTLLEIALNLQKSLNDDNEQIRSNIEQYRKDMVFNLGHSKDVFVRLLRDIHSSL